MSFHGTETAYPLLPDFVLQVRTDITELNVLHVCTGYCYLNLGAVHYCPSLLAPTPDPWSVFLVVLTAG